MRARSASACIAELVPRVLALAQLARDYDIGFNIDAEEADRLDLSLDLFAALAADPALAGWDGLGFVVQAYQKRARAVIDWLVALAPPPSPPADGAARSRARTGTPRSSARRSTALA